MSPALLAWLATLRAEASEPGFICRSLRASSGQRVALMADEILQHKTDAELWAHVTERFKEG